MRPARGDGLGLRRLGDLELRVLRSVWRRKRATIRDVFADLASDRALAYTTAATVIARLTHKGMLHRKRAGTAFCYVPAASEKKVIAAILDSTVDRLLDGDLAPLIATLGRRKTLLKTGDVSALEDLGKSLRRR
ncbi:MAG: BlaI/MecI/CopY family transcriptional regulator [Candidatus Eremiobacteraeota bacterium]|nr:BlaI/MecI/CopY family transcriptional regulator [Candidatus Eremiobacteraeota bacterium]